MVAGHSYLFAVSIDVLQHTIILSNYCVDNNTIDSTPTIDPTPLQDLCLLVVINDLNMYPVSLLDFLQLHMHTGTIIIIIIIVMFASIYTLIMASKDRDGLHASADLLQR